MLFVFCVGLQVSMYAACGILLMKPHSGEGLAFSLVMALLMSLLCVCGKMVIGLDNPNGVIQVLTVLYVGVRSLEKYYFSLDATLEKYRHWNYLEDGCRMFCLVLMLLAGLIGELPVYASILVIMSLRCISGRVVLVFPSRERRIKASGEIFIVKKSAPSVLEPERESDIFEKIEDYMKSKKPYLEENFCMEDICAELLTNKLYVSKTINDCYEDNFRAYLNGYRIDYAKSLICSNPKVKMSDVAALSGYRCLATFNSSFKEITGMTPGDYSRQEIARQRLSRNQEREL